MGPLIAKAAEMEMPALALTDHGVMFGVADFYGKCKDKGVKPILGVEAYVAPRKHTDKQPQIDKSAYHMVLLARNETGYKNLLKLTTIAALEGYYYKPRIDRDLLQKYGEGLIATSACLGSEINSNLLRGDYEAARNACAFYRDLFGDGNYYIEIQNHNLPEQIQCNEQLLRIAKELSLPVICTNDVHYLTAGDADAHDILLCIGTGAMVHETDRLKYATQEFYLKSSEQMKQLFHEMHPQCIENTLGIAERCNVELEFGRCPMPSPGIPDGFTPHEYLTHLAEAGLVKKFNGNPSQKVIDRLKYELEVIQTTGFSQYILIVRDFAKFAEEKGIFYGVRGSAAGCLASYLVDITSIDPVEYGLTFERFLNPERVQMPDVDMDFEDTRRAEVIEYVTQKYSPNQADPTEARVAQIVTFGTLAARAVLKDSGRALGMPLGDVDKLSKMIPTLPLGMTIDKTLEAVPEFKNAYIRDPAARKLIDTAKRLEGISRHASVHAAGVIISHDALTDYTPLTRSADGGCVTQYSAYMLEKIGLLKMDFLGLVNLSILGQAVKNVCQSTGVTLDVRELPLELKADGSAPDVQKTYELLGAGECVGVFQLESPQMRRYVQELKPTSVRDVAAMVALYRPGPMAHIPRFVRCKHGLEKIEYPHPLLKEVLEETYGVIVYQDQVMRIAQIIAGYSLGQADILRRAMGKKKREEMEKERVNFLKGAAEKNISEKKANEIFDLMEPFAGYAFNKAHAVCYAMVAYQTAYLKANYPVEYMAALLACFVDKSDKLVTAMDECKRLGIKVLPPDVNQSGSDFTVEGTEDREQGTGNREQERGASQSDATPDTRHPIPLQAIRFGMAAIKGVGRAAVDVALKAREEGGPFTSLTDFCARVTGLDSGNVSRGVMEALIHSGAFASLPGHQNRRALIHVLDAALQAATRAQKDRKSGQASLADMFGDAEDDTVVETIPIPNVPEFARDQLLGFERDLLGLYISDHPLQTFLPTFEKRRAVRISDLAEMGDRQEVTLGGIITSIKPFTSKKSGEPMAFFNIEDMSGTVACTMFPKIFADFGDRLQKDAIVLLRGKTSHRERVREDDDGGVIVEILADEVSALSEASGKDGPKRIVIKLDPTKPEMLRYVKETVEAHRGNGGASEVFLHVPQGQELHVVRTPLFAEFNEPFRAAIERLLGRQTVWVE